jgi:hypothetical protein
MITKDFGSHTMIFLRQDKGFVIMGRGDLAQGARDALAPSCGVCYLQPASSTGETA